MNSNEPLVFHDVVRAASSSTPTMTGVPPFLDVHHRHFDGQLRVWKDPGEMDQFVEHVDFATSFRAQPASDDLAASRILRDELLATDDGFDDENTVTAQQVANLVADRRE